MIYGEISYENGTEEIIEKRAEEIIATRRKVFYLRIH